MPPSVIKHMDLTQASDHPAVLLGNAPNSGPYPTGVVAAAYLRLHEKEHEVTFAALDNDALEAVRDAYDSFTGSRDLGEREVGQLLDLRNAVQALLGLEA